MLTQGKRSIVTGVAALMVVPFLAFLGTGVWLYDDIYGSSGRLNKALESASAEGVPTHPGDWLTFRKVSPDDNAALPLKKLHQKWSQADSEHRRLIQTAVRDAGTPGADLTPDYSKGLSDGLEIIALAREAAGRSDCDFGFDWEDPTSLDFSIYYSTLEAGRLLASRASTLASNGNYGEAFRLLDECRALGKHLSRDGAMDALTVHLALENVALNHAEQILWMGRGSATAHQRFAAFLDDDASDPDVLRNLRGEAMYTVGLLSSKGSYDGRTFQGVKLTKRTEPFVKANGMRTVQFWEDVLPLVESVSPDWYDMATSYAEGFEEYRRSKSPSRILVQTIGSGYARTMASANSMDVRREMARVFQSVAQYHAKHGAFPESLTDLKTNLGDPCSEGIFVYKRLPEGFSLMSVGLDGIDDDGLVPDKGFGPSDIVLTVHDGTVTNKGF